MNSTRPYLIRAFFEWIVDNHCTPYIVIEADRPGVQVPEQYIDDGKIVLNISPLAVRDFEVTNHRIEFSAKFGGTSMKVHAPIAAVIAIYAQENGRGMVFSPDDGAEEDGDGGDDEPNDSGSGKAKGKPKLTLVK